MKRISSLFCVGALALLLGACAAPGPTPGEMEIRSGTIEQITAVQLAATMRRVSVRWSVASPAWASAA